MPTPLKMAIINNMASCNMLVVLQHALINRVQARRNHCGARGHQHTRSRSRERGGPQDVPWGREDPDAQAAAAPWAIVK